MTQPRCAIWPPLLTPFETTGAVDHAALDALVDFYLESGVDGLLVTGLSAEPFELTAAERLAIVRQVTRRIAGRIPVAVAVYPDERGDFCGGMARVEDAGAQTLVLLASTLAPQDAPDELVRERMEKAMAATSADLGLYEAPRPYKRLLDDAAIELAAQSRRFTFLKDTSEDLQTIARRLTIIGGSPLRLYNAEMASLRASVAMGAHGFCGLMANVFPAQVRRSALEPGPDGERLSQVLTLGDPALEKDYPASAKALLATAYGLKLGSHSRRLGRPANPGAIRGLQALHALLLSEGRMPPTKGMADQEIADLR